MKVVYLTWFGGCENTGWLPTTQTWISNFKTPPSRVHRRGAVTKMDGALKQADSRAFLNLKFEERVRTPPSNDFGGFLARIGRRCYLLCCVMPIMSQSITSPSFLFHNVACPPSAHQPANQPPQPWNTRTRVTPTSSKSQKSAALMSIKPLNR
jgi:hypothetical protein